VTETHGCKELAQSCYLTADWSGVKLNTLTNEPPNQQTYQLDTHCINKNTKKMQSRL